jgi:hypothetical protein
MFCDDFSADFGLAIMATPQERLAAFMGGSDRLKNFNALNDEAARVAAVAAAPMVADALDKFTQNSDGCGGKSAAEAKRYR